MNNYHFGFDIGCASVGWAVVDDDYNIIDLGSDLFDEASPENNKTRRERRSQRRMLRRRKNRIRDFKVQIWNRYVEPKLDNSRYNEIIDFLDKKFNTPLINIVELKVKGLANQLNLEELYFVLLNYCKHKGISYLDEEIDKDSDGKDDNKLSEYGKSLKLNQNELKDNFPCEIQLKRLQQMGSYRGQNETVNSDGEKESKINVFTTSRYVDEIVKLLNTQKKYIEFITDDFINDFVKLFKRKRDYFVGPGNELSRTDYGIFTTKVGNDGKYITDQNIFAKLVGRCSIYNKNNGREEEFRASASSYSAEYYNLLNDLNNIRINGESFTKEEREKIVKNVINQEKLGDKTLEKMLLNIKNANEGALTGARVDKEGNHIFHKFECYRKLKKFLDDRNIDIEKYDKKVYNKIIDVLTINTERDSIKKSLENSIGLKTENEDGIKLNLSNDDIAIFQEFRAKNGSLFTKWHSFSYKVLDVLIPMMLETGNEQMTCLCELGLKKRNEEKLSERARLSKNIITSEIYNPVVVRSTRMSIDILNALIKKYGYPKEIVIEMPRDKNSDEEKKRINNEQKNNEKELNNIIDKINKEYGIKLEYGDKYFKAQKNLTLKLKLWEEQKHKCIYSGKIIDIKDLLNDYSKFEIDHIIPLSISLDDSRTNKVLVYNTENQRKGQRTSYDYISSGEGKLDISEFEVLVKTTYAGNKQLNKKVQNLLCKDDISSKIVRDGFVSRNLNDTRYASREFLNAVQNFFDRKDVNTKVKVITGKFTHQMRSGLGLIKDRDESFAHHAIDASLICFSQMGYDNYISLQKPYVDAETGEILDMEKYKSKTTEEVYKDVLYQNKWKKIKDNIVEAEKVVKFYRKVDWKANRQISDETIYGTRTKNGKIYKINSFSIRDKDGVEKFVKYNDNLLVKDFDTHTFNYLQDIIKNYSDDKNAFIAYEKDTGNKVRKYAKDGNGAIITKLKYYGDEARKCIDISTKYGQKPNSKKIILDQLKPYRTDVYYNNKIKKYKFVGVKQNTLKYDKGRFSIDIPSYELLLKEFGVINENERYKDIMKNGYVFKLSFYDNDIIYYKKLDDENRIKEYIERHHSLNTKNKIQTKPVNKDKFDGKKQNIVTVTDVKSVKKVIVDVLGNEKYITSEIFNNEIK